MKYAWLVMAIFAARCFAVLTYPASDGDLGWQRRLGMSILRSHRIPGNLGNGTFTAAFHPWIAQEWAFSTFAALGQSGVGWWLFAGSCALAAVAALAVAAHTAERRGASPRAIALCTALAGVALYGSFGVRAQVVAWPFAALVIALLELEGSWAYAALVVAALWSNLHASAMLAPLIAASLALGTWLDEGRPQARVRRAFVLAGGCALAVCCNPFGLRLPGYALGLLMSDFKRYIDEWRPTALGEQSFAFGALPLLLIALMFLGGRQPRRARDLFVLVPFTYLLLSAERNIALFAIVALPIAACALTRDAPHFALPNVRAGRLARLFEGFVLPAFSVALATIVAIATVHLPDRGSDDLGTRALAVLRATPGEHRLLCTDFAWCGPAVGLPHVRVFLDGRADPYPAAVWTDYVAVAGLHARWRAPLDFYRVDAVLVAVGAPLDQALALTAGWNSAYRDRTFRLWLRPPVSREISTAPTGC